ncbi:MAG: polysaccharide biosynthesis C-terminal domain-containing protein [Bacteroidales bacterium]|nr:polysaccharide biosynthesis C-terminal domain-containing protein [Bacteroidales bacterium]
MFKKIVNTFFTKVFTAVSSFAVLVLVSHILGTEGKGEQAIIAFNISILTLFFTFLGNSCLIYLTPRKDFTLLFIPSLLWMLLLSAVFALLACFVPYFNGQYIWITLIIALIASLSEFNYFVLMGKEKVFEANNVKLIYTVVSLVIVGILALTKRFNGIEDYIFALFIAYCLSLFYGIFVLRKDFKGIYFPNKGIIFQNAKTIFSLGGLKQSGTIAQNLNYRLSFYILAYFWGKDLVGIYSNACSISEAIMMFGTSLALVQYSDLSNNNSAFRAKQLTIKLTKLNAVFTFVAMLVICFLPESFWVFVFGEGFGEIAWVVKLLAVGVTLLSCSSNFTQYFASFGNFSISAFASFFGLAVTLLLSLLLIPSFGLSGAAISASASYIATFSLELIYFIKWTRKK